MKDNSFKMAIAASLAAHIAIFSYKPTTAIFLPVKSFQKFEVSYYKVAYEPRRDDIKLALKGEIRVSKKEAVSHKALADARQDSAAGKKQEVKFYKTESEQKIEVKKAEAKPAEEKKRESEKKKVTLPPAPQAASQTKAYLDYYEILRQKIKGCIIYPDIGSAGEVHLAFALSRDGGLKEVLIDGAKSTQDARFRDAAVRGIQDASPFPPFPKGLPQETQSFNVIISFEAKR